MAKNPKNNQTQEIESSSRMAKNSKNNQTQEIESSSRFAQVVEQYIQQAKWTNQELMNAIKVGETQFYRWKRSESTPRKAIVNRIAVALADRINHIEKQEPHDLFPGSDQIDGILNELLQAAGYSASVTGKGKDSNWDKIAKNKAWTLGYTKTPISDIPDKAGAKPRGIAIEYAEKIGRMLGLHTEWKYLSWDKMSSAIREREIDAIAPLMIVLPGRFFDYRFSEPCSMERLSLSAIISASKSVNYFEELPINEVELIYVKGEIGEWGVDVLDKIDQAIACQDNQEAITKLISSSQKIGVFLSDNITCQQIAAQKQLHQIKFQQIKNIKTYLAFAFHPDEPQLITAVNSAIKLIEQFAFDSHNQSSNPNN